MNYILRSIFSLFHWKEDISKTKICASAYNSSIVIAFENSFQSKGNIRRSQRSTKKKNNPKFHFRGRIKWLNRNTILEKKCNFSHD